jgi:YD repeat-containing protein
MAVQMQISYSYDALDRLVEARYPDGTVVRYTYDPAGNRTALTVSGPAAPASAAPAAAAVTCPQCGTPAGPEVQFCITCGKKLR